uniref:Transcription factor IIIA n=1 Tax=Eptatretus burgeri TaxID=7764 RepID=A0A8C4QPD0_EPTBU
MARHSAHHDDEDDENGRDGAGRVGVVGDAEADGRIVQVACKDPGSVSGKFLVGSGYLTNTFTDVEVSLPSVLASGGVIRLPVLVEPSDERSGTSHDVGTDIVSEHSLPQDRENTAGTMDDNENYQQQQQQLYVVLSIVDEWGSPLDLDDPLLTQSHTGAFGRHSDNLDSVPTRDVHGEGLEQSSSLVPTRDVHGEGLEQSSSLVPTRDVHGEGLEQSSSLVPTRDVHGEGLKQSSYSVPTRDVHGEGLERASYSVPTRDVHGEGLKQASCSVLTRGVHGEGLDQASYSVPTRDVHGEGLDQASYSVPTRDVHGEGLKQASHSVPTRDVHGEGLEQASYSVPTRDVHGEGLGQASYSVPTWDVHGEGLEQAAKVSGDRVKPECPTFHGVADVQKANNGCSSRSNGVGVEGRRQQGLAADEGPDHPSLSDLLGRSLDCDSLASLVTDTTRDAGTLLHQSRAPHADLFTVSDDACILVDLDGMGKAEETCLPGNGSKGKVDDHCERACSNGRSFAGVPGVDLQKPLSEAAVSNAIPIGSMIISPNGECLISLPEGLTVRPGCEDDIPTRRTSVTTSVKPLETTGSPPAESALSIGRTKSIGNGKAFQCPYTWCTWSFSTGYKLRRHVVAHEKQRPFLCDLAGCGKRFSTVYNLRAHTKAHLLERTHVCDVCAMAFHTQAKLTNHRRVHEEPLLGFKCEWVDCDKAFSTASSLSRHARSHEREPEVFCCSVPGCGKVYDRACRLTVHLRSHTGERPFRCEFEGCHWTFTCMSKLLRHKRKHENDRQFVCHAPGCGKTFTRAEHLKGHAITHSGTRPFHCPVEGCGMSFSARSSLYVHARRHQAQGGGVRPGRAQCPVLACARIFDSARSAKTHMMRMHNLGPAQLAHLESFGCLVPLSALQPGDPLETVEHLTSSCVTDDLPLVPPDLSVAVDASSLSSDMVTMDSSGLMLLVATSMSDVSPGNVSTRNTHKEFDSSTSSTSIQLGVCSSKASRGSARTDLRAVHIAKRRKRKGSQVHAAVAQGVGKKNKTTKVPTASALSAARFAGLGSVGLQFMQNQFLQQDEGTGEPDLSFSLSAQVPHSQLPADLPVNILQEQPLSVEDEGAGDDFPLPSSSVTGFSGSTINLQDLA